MCLLAASLAPPVLLPLAQTTLRGLQCFSCLCVGVKHVSKWLYLFSWPAPFLCVVFVLGQNMQTKGSSKKRPLEGASKEESQESFEGVYSVACAYPQRC